MWPPLGISQQSAGFNRYMTEFLVFTLWLDRFLIENIGTIIFWPIRARNNNRQYRARSMKQAYKRAIKSVASDW